MIVAERDIDLFAGPGGWETAVAELGIRPLGIEWDDAACATRRAAGHETLQADVSALDPRDFAPCRLLIASPPCQAFSMAGKGAGRKALAAYVTAISRMAHPLDPWGPSDVATLDEACSDERAHLVLEPLRWALRLRPRLIACEQVEPVLPLWEAMAGALRERGYGTWTGVLSSERFGVPQTRKRAILLAVRDGEVSEPPASHQRYVPPRVKAKQEDSLFAAPPERIVAPEDRELLPWVSMAQALGWPSGEDLVGFPRRAESDRGWDHETAPTFTAENGVEYRERDLRSASEPAQVVTEKARSWTRLRANSQWVHDRPATTVAGDPRIFPPGHKVNEDDLAAGRGGQRRSGAGWTERRPATTVNGDPRIAEPNVNRKAIDPATGEPYRQFGDRAVRVSVQEAAVLQSFPPDYPWDGLARPPHIARSRSVEDDLALAHELVGDPSQRVVRFFVLPLAGQEREVFEAVVALNAVDVVHNLVRLRAGDHAVLRIERAASEHVATILPEGGSHGAALVRVERITVEAPLLPVSGAEVPRDGAAFTVLARCLSRPTVDAELAVSKAGVVQFADAFAEDGALAVFDLADVHVRRRYRWAGSTRTKQFEQCGNAVPPLLARAILTHLLR